MVKTSIPSPPSYFPPILTLGKTRIRAVDGARRPPGLVHPPLGRTQRLPKRRGEISQIRIFKPIL